MITIGQTKVNHRINESCVGTMKIAIVISSLTGGGAERVAVNLHRHFLHHMKDQLTSDLIILNHTGDYHIDEEAYFINEKYSANPIKKAMYHFLLYRYKLRHLKKRRKYDVVISFSTLSNRLNIRTRRNEKVIISVRNYASFIHDPATRKKLKKEYSKSDKIIAVSEQCRNDLLNAFGLSVHQVTTIYNPYRINHIVTEGSQNVETEEETLFEDGKTVISVGRFSDQKAFWRLIKAIAEVKKTIPDVKLVLLGKEERGSKHTQLLTSLINHYQLENNVFLLGFKGNPYAYIKKSRLFVLCSKYEGFPNALTEAMCLGIPVVSIDCLSGPREILAPELDVNTPLTDPLKASYGVLVPQYPAPEHEKQIVEHDRLLASAICEILENESLHRYYNEAATTRAQDFEAGIIAQQWVEQFKEVISEFPSTKK